MSETRILIRLLWIYFPRNWEFGSALSKILNFGGGEGEHPKRPLDTPLSLGKQQSFYGILLVVHRTVWSYSVRLFV
jgi:hypothetical protein